MRRALHVFGWAGAMLAAVMVLPLMLAVALGEEAQILHFAYALLWVLFGSGLLIVTTRPAPEKRAGAPPAAAHWLFVGLLLWVGLPLWGALPLWGNQGLGFGGAWFESLSGFTTTGATLLARPEDAPAAVLLWRSLLNGCGAVWTISFALTIVLPLRCGGLDCKPGLPGEGETDMLLALRQQSLVVGGLFSLFAAAGALGLMLSGVTPLWAVCLAVSGLATGGFAPTAAPLSGVLPAGALVLFSLLLFVGALSFPLWPGLALGAGARRAGRARARPPLRASRMLRDGEWRGFCLWLVLWTAAGAVCWNWTLGEAAMLTLNFASTGGFQMLPEATLGEAAAVWLMLPMLIGGMSLSTAGGSKFLRAALAWGSVQHALRRLVMPHAAGRIQLGGHQIRPAHIAACWAHFASLFLLLGASLLVGSWALDLTLPQNLQFIVANLSNVNYQSLGAPVLQAAPLTGAAMICAGLLMLAGRMELVLFLLLLHPLLWRSLRAR